MGDKQSAACDSAPGSGSSALGPCPRCPLREKSRCERMHGSGGGVRNFSVFSRGWVLSQVPDSDLAAPMSLERSKTLICPKKSCQNTWSWKTSCSLTILGCPSQSFRAVISFWVLASILQEESSQPPRTYPFFTKFLCPDCPNPNFVFVDSELGR